MLYVCVTTGDGLCPYLEYHLCHAAYQQVGTNYTLYYIPEITHVVLFWENYICTVWLWKSSLIYFGFIHRRESTVQLLKYVPETSEVIGTYVCTSLCT